MILSMRLVMPLIVIGALAIIVIFLMPLAVPYIDNALSYKYIEIL